jgi:SPP1 family predicted phage head-tail adaptor
MSPYRVNPSKYRHIITIQKQTTTRDPYGQIKEEWTDVLKTRAAIYPISGREVFQRDFVESEISHRIHVRYNPTIVINSQMRILFGQRLFTITAPPINYQEKNEELQILCKEDE